MSLRVLRTLDPGSMLVVLLGRVATMLPKETYVVAFLSMSLVDSSITV